MAWPLARASLGLAFPSGQQASQLRAGRSPGRFRRHNRRRPPGGEGQAGQVIPRLISRRATASSSPESTSLAMVVPSPEAGTPRAVPPWQPAVGSTVRSEEGEDGPQRQAPATLSSCHPVRLIPEVPRPPLLHGGASGQRRTPFVRPTSAQSLLRPRPRALAFSVYGCWPEKLQCKCLYFS